jgi:hypothetical protein
MIHWVPLRGCTQDREVPILPFLAPVLLTILLGSSPGVAQESANPESHTVFQNVVRDISPATFLDSSFSLTENANGQPVAGYNISAGGYTAYLTEAGEEPVILWQSSNRTFNFSQSNALGQMVIRDRANGPSFRIRRLEADPTKHVLLQSPALDSYNSVTRPSINNFGQVVFNQSVGDFSFTKLMFIDPLAGGLASEVLTFSGNSSIPVMLSDDGKVAYRNSGLDSIQTVRIVGASIDSVASAALGFSNVGSAPGISDDGRVVAFIAELDGRQGVFVSFWEENEWTIPLRLSGVAGNSVAEPGDASALLQRVIPGMPDPVGEDEIGPAAYEASNRINVNPAFSVPNGEEATKYRVAFVATDARRGTSRTALFSAVVDSATNTLIAAPKVVTGVGDSLSITLPNTLSSLGIYDSVDQSGRIGLLYSDSSGAEGIVVASRRGLVMRQNETPWGNEVYAENQIAAYIDQLEAEMAAGGSNPDIEQLPRLRRIIDPDNGETNDLAAKGCYLTSLALVLSHLDVAHLNPHALHDILDARGGVVSEIDSIMRTEDGQVRNSAATGLPRFHGADLRHAPYLNEFGLIQIDETDAGALWDTLMAEGNEQRGAIVQVGFHRIAAMSSLAHADSLARGIRVLDPFLSRNNASQDRLYDRSERTDFISYLTGRQFVLGRLLSARVIPFAPRVPKDNHARSEFAFFQGSAGTELVITAPSGRVLGSAVNQFEDASYTLDVPFEVPESNL